ncbi:MAG: glycosyltransferase [Actinomycetota bacterium]
MGPSSGGIRRHVRFLAYNPPAGFKTAGVAGPAGLSGYFETCNFFTTGDGGFPLADIAPDVIHAHGLTAGAQALRWTALGTKGPPVVVTVHTSMQQTLRASAKGAGSALAQKAMWRAARVGLRRAAGVIAVSAGVQDELGFGDVVPPALDLPVAEPGARAKVRTELGTPEDRTVILAVGRLHPDKRLDIFIDAVEGSGAEGWIAGEGPHRESLQARAEDSGVRLLGHRTDVGNLLAAADIFALPAHAESYGFAVMEAVAAGLPVVATRTGAIAELVGNAGLLVEPDDAGAFREALVTLLGSVELRATLAKAAAERALPSPAELVARVGGIYDRVLS